MRKAEEKGTSGGLLGKLHYGVVQILEEVDILLQSSPSDWVDVSDRLRVSWATSVPKPQLDS